MSNLDAETEAERQKATDALVWNASLRLAQGQSPEHIESVLVAKGLSQPHAVEIVMRALNSARETGHASGAGRGSDGPVQQHDPIFQKMHAGLKQGKGRDDMVLGAFIFLVGIGITGATASAAPEGGGAIVAWGAILYGAVRFIKGAIA